MATLAPFAWPVRGPVQAQPAEGRPSPLPQHGRLCDQRYHRRVARVHRGARLTRWLPDTGRGPLVAVVIPRSTSPGRSGASSRRSPTMVASNRSSSTTARPMTPPTKPNDGATVILRRTARGGVGAAIRDGWRAGAARGAAVPRAHRRRRPAQPRGARGALDHLMATDADYLQGSRWSRAAMSSAPRPDAASGRVYSVGVQPPRRAVESPTRRTVPHFPHRLLNDPRIGSTSRGSTATSWSRTCSQGHPLGYRVIEHP